MITAQVDSFAASVDALKPLFLGHWSELALFKDRMALDPQYQEYIARERAGTLVLVTVRRDGLIVAYHIVQIAPGFHYGTTLTAISDIYYVIPKQRGKGLVYPLFRAVEKELKRRGVQLWISGHKTGSPLQMPGIFGALGFEPCDTHYAKWIGH